MVELYTSQGCASCPPADALMGKLAQRLGVIALSLPITYWDMLGWKDTLANDANTRRQKAYAAAMNHGGVYTPQIVVDGMVDVVGSRAANVDAAIAQRRAAIAVGLATTIARADTGRGEARADSAAPAAAWATHPADPAVNVAVRQSLREMHVDLGAAPGAHNATVCDVPFARLGQRPCRRRREPGPHDHPSQRRRRPESGRSTRAAP